MKKPLPTHADELDVLRLQNAMLIAERAKKEFDLAQHAFAELLAKAANRYKFDPSKGDGISFSTREINRAPQAGK